MIKTKKKEQSLKDNEEKSYSFCSSDVEDGIADAGLGKPIEAIEMEDLEHS